MTKHKSNQFFSSRITVGKETELTGQGTVNVIGAEASSTTCPSLLFGHEGNDDHAAHIFVYKKNNISDLRGCSYNGSNYAAGNSSGYRDWFNGTNHRRELKVYSEQTAGDNINSAWTESMWWDLTTGDVTAKQDFTVEGTTTLGKVNFTTGETTRFRGLNYLNLGTNETEGGTTSVTQGFTADGSKFNNADSVLYKTGFGFQGYDDYNDTYSSSARNAYIAGQDGVNLYTNSTLRARITAGGDFQIKSDIEVDGTLEVDGTTTLEGKIEAHGGIVIQDEQDGGAGRGIYYWNKASSSHTSYLATSGEGRSIAGGTSVAGHNFSSHSIRFRENNDSSNGFIFENTSEQLVFSINSGDKSAYCAGSFAVGTTSPDPNAIMDLTSTTKPFLPPRMTTTQRDAVSSPTVGMMIFNTTVNRMQCYISSSWTSLH